MPVTSRSSSVASLYTYLNVGERLPPAKIKAPGGKVSAPRGNDASPTGEDRARPAKAKRIYRGESARARDTRKDTRAVAASVYRRDGGLSPRRGRWMREAPLRYRGESPRAVGLVCRVFLGGFGGVGWVEFWR